MPNGVQEKAPIKTKKTGKWFRKIPKELLLSPGGMILVFLALIIEIIDWIPLPLVDQLWELPLEIIFIVFFLLITKVPLQSAILPFIVERIPAVNDILPTWLIRMFM